MKIAGKLTVTNWNELKVNLDKSNNINWDSAFDFFEERIRTRYLNPIKAILDVGSNAGEGFAVVNLQCSLIETIESFINGWVNEFDIDKRKPVWKKEGVIAKYPTVEKTKNLRNVDIFTSFFKERIPFNTYHILGNEFFRDVRCGLLHETQTKNNWKIKKGKNSDKAFEVDSKGFKIIYRENFQKAIETVVQKYKDAIINGNEFDEISSCELRKNFIYKFNHICNISKEMIV